MMLNNQSAETADPLNHFVFSLPKDNVKRVLVNRILAHSGKHFERPWKLFSVASIKRSVLFEMLIKCVKNSFKMNDFLGIVLPLILVDKI